MKAFTNLPQSKKLVEILPIESADMCYRIVAYNPNDTHVYQPYCFSSTLESDIPCWSLAALLDAIPKCIGDYNIFRMDINDIDTSMWYDEIGYGVNTELPDITLESPTDACVEMIIKLKENNLI